MNIKKLLLIIKKNIFFASVSFPFKSEIEIVGAEHQFNYHGLLQWKAICWNR